MASQVRYGTLEDERVSSELMDEKRQENTAYEYLCHLEEARVWIQACINEELPPATELEEQLRNGVYLAKLGHFVAPAVVPVSKIYDFDQSIYRTRGLQFRHTENINYWFRAMTAVGMPSYCLPDTFDIYDKRNMPKAIHYLHAFSMLLFKKGLAPKIEDLLGKLTFTAEEIDAMQQELDKYAIQMPSFNKVGGILAGELPLDAAALHASIIVVNKALEKKNSKFLESLHNPHAHLNSVVDEYEDRYKQGMNYSRRVKMQNKKRKEKANYVSDIYDELLTHEEIQQSIHEINEIEALDTLDIALMKADIPTTMKILKSPHLKISEVEPNNKEIYLQLLLAERDLTIDNNNSVLLSRAEVQRIVRKGNQIALDEMELKEVVMSLNRAIESDDMQRTIACLKDKRIRLPSLFEDAGELYHKEFFVIRQAKGSDLSYEDVVGGARILTAIAAINIAIQKKDSKSVLNAVQNPDVHLTSVNGNYKEMYLNALLDAWERKSSATDPTFLTHDEIQECIDLSNRVCEERQAKELACSNINSAVSSGDTDHVLKSLMHPAASILCIDRSHIVLYTEVLQAAQRHQSSLSLNAIQQEVNAANKLAQEANKTAMAVVAINMAVKDQNSSMLLEILEKQDAYIGPVNPECTEDYMAELMALQTGKNVEECDENCDNWLHLSFGEQEYYFNCNTFEYCWLKPKGDANFDSFLQHHHIQSTVSRVNSARKQKCLQNSIEPAVVKFQAHVRRYLFAKQKERRHDYFSDHEEEIVMIQRWWRNLGDRTRMAKSRLTAASTIQFFFREWLLKKRHLERIKMFKDKEESVRKFQCFWRAKRHLRNLRMANPHLAEVWEHIPVLINSTRDNVEEIELHKARADVVQRIRKNKDLERRVNDMDVKIGLIVRNKITSDEFAKEGRKGSLQKKDSLESYDSRGSTVRRGLKALNMESRNMLENYQHLFYMLQIDPRYLARLIFAMSPGHSFKFVESVIYTLFNYGSTPREEYLLLLLFRYALEEEFRCKVEKVVDVSCGNTLLFKMVVNFNRCGCGQSNLRNLLEGPVSNILQKENLGIDPIEIYQRWINQQETETGVMSSLPYDVLAEEALKIPHVVEEISKNISRLKKEALVFVDTICNSADKIPYGMRHIVRLLNENLRMKFPNISEEDILRTIGNLLYYRYINPAIAAPDVYEIVTLQPGESVTAEQRKNLGTIAKILHVAAAFKVFENGEKLALINDFVLECHKKFRMFFHKVGEVEEPQLHYDINTYTEDTLMTPPTVCLTLQEIFNTHELLCTHRDCVAPDPSDKLRELLRDIGKPQTLQNLLGEDESESAHLSKSEVCLFLTSKFAFDSGSPTVDSLFVETKRMVVHLLQCQPPRVKFSEDGQPIANLLNTIKSPPTKTEQKAYEELHNFSTFFQKDIVIPVLKQLATLGEFKEYLVNNLHQLELAKYIKKEDFYQEVVDKLHEDLSHNQEYRKKRREEIRKLKETLSQLEKKMEFYQSKLEYYENYMKNCLGTLNAPKKRLTLGSSQEGRQAKKVKCSAHKLMEKGIIVELNVTPVEARAVIFEIAPSSDAGVFNITVKLAATEIDCIDINIQDLLQKQYEGQALLEMFGKVKVNVNLLLHFLNKKFYCS